VEEERGKRERETRRGEEGDGRDRPPFPKFLHPPLLTVRMVDAQTYK